MDYFEDKGKFSVSDDPLLMVKRITFDAITKSLLYLVMIPSFLVHACFGIIFFAKLLTTFDGNALGKYGAGFFFDAIGLVGIVIAIYLQKPALEILNELYSHMWDFKRSSPQISQKISFDSKFLKRVIYINVITTYFTIIMYSPYLSKNNMLYGIWLIDTYFYQFSLPLTLIYLLTLLVLNYFLVGTTYALLYIVMYQKFHIYRLNKLITHISAGYKDFSDYHLIHNQNYQKIIHKRLIICIKCHQVLKLIERKLDDIILVPTLVQMGLAIAFIINTQYSLIFVENQHVDRIRVLSAVFGGGTCVVFSLNFGQSLIDESLKIFDNASRCPWTAWNVKNRRILLLFLTNCQQSSILGCRSIFTCDHAALLKMVQFVFSTCTFLLRVVEMKNNEPVVV